MSKTPSSNSDETIEKLQLRLIELEAEINNPMPNDPFSFMTHGLRKLEREREVIKEQISFLAKKGLDRQLPSRATTKTVGNTKQEIIYRKVEAMQKRHPKMTKTAIFSELSDTIPESSEASIKKAYYAQSAKLESDRKAKQKRDSGSKSGQSGQGEKSSPTK